MRRTFCVDSTGRTLPLVAPAQLACWWSRLSPHVPGATASGLGQAAEQPVDLVVPAGLGPRDTRRLINAHLHRLHLRHDTLSLHAVALERPGNGGAVLILGGHGAGKTLTALALAVRGWRLLAGDVTLLDAKPFGKGPLVRGGTSAFMVRRTPVRRWFPWLGVGADGPKKFDLSGYMDLAGGNGAAAPVRVAAAAVVDVDGDPCAGDGHAERIDTHTAATAWLRASSHLLDRMLDHGDTVLRQVEDAEAVRRRMARIYELARIVPLAAVWGRPQAIATHVEMLAARDE